MAFIRVQKAVRDPSGAVVGGSASIIDVTYVADAKYHSKQVIRECLGSVISLENSKRRGIFLSPTRGLVEYDADSDIFTEVSASDGRVAQHKKVSIQTAVHTVFGDAYMLLSFLRNSGLLTVLRAAFPGAADYQRLLSHILHGILKDGSKITCDNFMTKSFASYLLVDVPTNSLKSDTAFFTMMGEDSSRLNFFRSYVDAMRKNVPGFGCGCYIDSTPLPNDIADNPFNALCSHGIGELGIQSRLVLVLDKLTGLPVWYDLIPGNVLDLSTLRTVFGHVSESLGIQIDDVVLDAGYVSKDLLKKWNLSSGKEMIARMPAKKGFPFKELYHQHKALIGKGKYAFVRGGHVYFGKRKEVEIFDCRINAYIYVDQENALSRWKNYLAEHAIEVEAMKDCEKDWMAVKFGYFILLSSCTCSPEELLSRYFERTSVETVFKTSKEYLDLLPLRKWSEQTIRGKILYDAIDTIVYLTLRKPGQTLKTSVSYLVVKTQSLMCCMNKNGQILVDTPNRQVKECYAALGLSVPSAIKLDSLKKELGLSAL